MRMISDALAAFVLVMGFFCNQLARAQFPLPAIAWEKRFPDSIDWYVHISSGILLVRADKTLYAVDGKDGRELWTIKDLDLGGRERGKNIVEIPGTPYLLLRRPGPETREYSGSLEWVDLWTGKQGGLESGEVRNFLTLVPLYESERILLVTGPGIPGQPFKARLQLRPMFEHQFEKVAWREDYPGQIGMSPLNLVGFYVSGRHLYVYKVEIHSIDTRFEVGHVDLQTGKRTWNFVEGYRANFSKGGVAPLLFVDGKILLAGKDLFALDPVSGKPLWTVKDLGKISHLIHSSGVLFALGEEGALSLDVSTGQVRWRVKSQGYAAGPLLFDKRSLLVFRDEAGLAGAEASSGKVLWRVESKNITTDPIYYEATDTLTFCDKSELIAVEASSGKVLRRTPLKITEQPVFARRVGDNFLFVTTEKDAVLFDITTGQMLWMDKIPDAVLLPLTFLQGLPLPATGSSGVPGEVKLRKPGAGAFIGTIAAQAAWQFLFGAPMVYFEGRVSLLPVDWEGELRSNWNSLQQRSAYHPAWQTALERLERSLKEEGNIRVYATEMAKDKWKLWRIDPNTGQRQEWILNGKQPDVIHAFSLAYTFIEKTLRAFQLAGH